MMYSVLNGRSTASGMPITASDLGAYVDLPLPEVDVNDLSDDYVADERSCSPRIVRLLDTLSGE